MQNAKLDEAQAGIKIAGRNITNLRYADVTILMAENEELKSLLMKVKKESEKAALNSTFRKLRSRHPVQSFHGKQIKRQWKQSQTLFSWAPTSLQMVTATMKLKDSFLLFERKSMTSLDSILKSREITLPTKVHLVRSEEHTSELQSPS